MGLSLWQRVQVGYIRLASFPARAQQDVARAVRSLAADGAQEFELDLRANRGGLVQEGIEVARLFLEGTGPATEQSHAAFHTPFHMAFLHNALQAHACSNVLGGCDQQGLFCLNGYGWCAGGLLRWLTMMGPARGLDCGYDRGARTSS